MTKVQDNRRTNDEDEDEQLHADGEGLNGHHRTDDDEDLDNRRTNDDAANFLPS